LINVHGYDEDFWGNLAQWQTLNPAAPVRPNWYYGYDKLVSYDHPYMDLPRLPLDERFASFCSRLEDKLRASTSAMFRRTTF
jgi:hypothetical protein